MSGHTKQSPAFKQKIEALIIALSAEVGERTTVLAEVIDVLRNNTTDSRYIVKAAEDEPIFVLRGSDITAGGGPELRFDSGVVDFWCELQTAHLLAVRDLAKAKIADGKIADARDCAREMRAYPNRKWPD